MRTVLSVAQVEALRCALSESGVLFLEQTKLLSIARSIVPDILNETVFRCLECPLPVKHDYLTQQTLPSAS
jgi:hypothetical protein